MVLSTGLCARAVEGVTLGVRMWTRHESGWAGNLRSVLVAAVAMAEMFITHRCGGSLGGLGRERTHSRQDHWKTWRVNRKDADRCLLRGLQREQLSSWVEDATDPPCG